MKKIDLQIDSTFSMVFDMHNLPEPQEVDGRTIIPLGTMDIGKQSGNMVTARENGGKVIWATTTIEHKLETLIIDYLFDPPIGEANMRRDFFSNNILKTSFFSYSVKKELAIQIVSKHDLLIGKDKNSLQKLLKRIMDYRNSFAHGHLNFQNEIGVILTYFSRVPKSDILTDEYWTNLQSEFNQANELLDKAIQKID